MHDRQFTSNHVKHHGGRSTEGHSLRRIWELWGDRDVDVQSFTAKAKGQPQNYGTGDQDAHPSECSIACHSGSLAW
jgi:hypothetical protein